MLSNYGMFVSLKQVLYTVRLYGTFGQNCYSEMVSCNVYLLLLLRNWTICRRLLVRCSLSPTLFIYFWTSTADGSEYLPLSASTGILLVVSCVITMGSFSEGHLYTSSTANRSGSGSHTQQRWRDLTRLRYFKQRPLTWPPQQNSPERSLFAR